MQPKQGDFAPIGDPMTFLTGAQPSARRAAIGAGWHSLLLALGATALTLVMSASTAGYTLRGGFGDPDDAMRLVEVRSWLGGQGWYDLSAHRLDPPLGALMHWSRLVDLPTAALIKLFSVAVDSPTAEHWACVAVPTLWLLGLYLAMGRLAGVLAGAAARPIAILGTLLSGAALVAFLPGRIGHHAPETVVLVLAVAAALASLDQGRARQAAVAGALVALGLAMVLETLPFLGALCAIMVAFWIVRGEAFASALSWFGLGLAVALPALFLVDVAPAQWLAPICDEMGAAHLGAGLIGGLGAIALARASARLASPGRRAAAAMLVGAPVLIYLVLAYPSCLGSPFAGVDPLVRTLWLDNVVESKPLLQFVQGRTMMSVALLTPLVLGLVGSLHAVFRAKRTAQSATALRFAAIAALTALGLALTYWQMRVVGSVTPLALCGGVHLVLVWRDRLAARGLALLAAFAPLLILPFTSTGLAVALPDDAHADSGPKVACLAPESLTPLAALGPGRVVAPINLGSHLLVATPLDVFAAPYHRNNDGNRFMMDVFLATPEKARTMLAARGATYVVTCGGETANLAARAPDGLAARLAAGAIPAYLRRVPVPGSPYDVFAVTSSR